MVAIPRPRAFSAVDLQRTPQPSPVTGGGTQLDITKGLGAAPSASGQFDSGTTNVLFGASDFAEQLRNPTLVDQQARAIEAIRRTAAARGLTGGAVDLQVQQATQRFRAGNRLAALQGLQAQTHQRIGAFGQQISPFLSLSRGSVGPLDQLRPQFEESLFGGLQSLGFGNVLEGEALRREGGNPTLGLNFAATSNPLLAERLQQTFSGDAFDIPEPLRNILGPERSREFARKQAAGDIGRFLERSFRTLENEALGLDVFSLGAGLADPESVLSADVGQFENLLNFFSGGSPLQGPAALDPSKALMQSALF